MRDFGCPIESRIVVARRSPRNTSIKSTFVQAVFVALTTLTPCLVQAATAIDGVSFADDPHNLFVPLEEIAPALGWESKPGQDPSQILLNGQSLDSSQLRKLTNGTILVPLNELQPAGATIRWADDGMEALIGSGFFKKVAVRFAEKRVEVDLANQRLRAYQGERLVLDSHISSGREGRKTPPGDFKAGPLKSPMHRSRLYHNAPMPWSVQVHKNIFIHGFQKVPRHPASHGCIRLPMTGANPARWFYDWIDIGTPVSIKGHWPVAIARPESPTVLDRLFTLPKVIVTVGTIIACALVILFGLQRRGKT